MSGKRRKERKQLSKQEKHATAFLVLQVPLSSLLRALEQQAACCPLRVWILSDSREPSLNHNQRSVPPGRRQVLGAVGGPRSAWCGQAPAGRGQNGDCAGRLPSQSLPRAVHTIAPGSDGMRTVLLPFRRLWHLNMSHVLPVPCVCCPCSVGRCGRVSRDAPSLTPLQWSGQWKWAAPSLEYSSRPSGAPTKLSSTYLFSLSVVEVTQCEPLEGCPQQHSPLSAVDLTWFSLDLF